MSKSLEDAAVAMVRGLKDAGHEAYWVGGCVRDRLRGVAPKDYDLATSARPEEVRALYPKSDLVGAHFGVVIVVEHGAAFEIATFRRDGVYVDRRRPSEVSFGTLEDDAARRDFTVNALYYDPIDNRTIDLGGGQRDLADGVLRCIGVPAERFEEDALRLLRAVRFAIALDMTIDPLTRDALCEKAPLIAAVSPERIGDELVRVFTGPRRGAGLVLLSETGLLQVVLPEVEAMRGVEQPREFHPEGDVFEHTRLVLEHLESPPSAALAMGALLHDVGKPPTFRRAPDRIRFDRHTAVGAEMADAICQRLRFSNRRREAIVSLVARHMRFMDVGRMKVSTLRRFMSAPNFDEDLALHRADALASHGDALAVDYCRRKREEFLSQSETILPPPLIGGDDLIAMGHPPGPRFKEILDAVADRQMEGEIATREEAMAWIGKRFPVN